MEKIEIFGEYDKDLKSNVVIKTIDHFEDFKKGITVFRCAPYYEILSEQDMKDEYANYVDNGIAFGCYLDGELAGLNCIVYEDDKKHSIAFGEDDRIAYYAGLAVRKEHRGKGIGKLLVNQTDLFLQNLNMFDYSYARILVKGSMSEGIFRKYDFEDILVDGKLIVDDVDYERNNPTVPTSDQRKYMGKAFTKTYTLKRR